MTDRLEAITWPVRTERLLLRRATPDDAEATWSFRRIPEVTEYMTAAPATLEAYRERFLGADRLRKTLIVEQGGEMVGDLMLAVRDGWAQAEVAEQAKDVEAEIGWCIAPPHTRKGLATEGAEAMLRLSFDVLGLRRVLAQCFADNVASWRIMEKLGMRRETRTVKESLLRTGAWVDGLGYAILADEWRARVTSKGDFVARP